MLRTAILIQMTFSLWFDDKAETFAFLALTRSSLTRSIADRSLSAKQTPAVEQVLKREIEHKNIIHDDGHYGILDGHIDPDHPTATLISEKQNLDIQQEVARALKTRAYPLFLLEKLFLNFEHFIDQNRNAGQDNVKELSGKVKERLVILGTGWGAAAMLKEIDTNKFDVTIISPRNYFLFTPMLAGAAVGTVEFRSITEPVRHINPHANYIEASASDIDSKKCIVRCESVACVGTSCVIEEFTVPYDRLVVAVGAQTNTFGIPGMPCKANFFCNFISLSQASRELIFSPHVLCSVFHV